MKDQPQCNSLLDLFLQDTPLLDVRAPVEYEKGAFPHTTNIAILNNKEREAIGICYKQQGQEEAIKLGESFVQGELKAQRIAHWKAFVKQHPQGVLYCFRGGLRSQITQQWIKEHTGIAYPRVAGGYKAMRHFLIEAIERLSQSFDIIVLGGRTGSGKTRVLKQLDNSLDLEGLANHRGSAFGATPTPQPSQIDFENQLAIEMLKQEARGKTTLIVEDEGRNIGSLHLPVVLYQAMQHADIVLMEVADEERIEVTICEYVEDVHKKMLTLYSPAEAFEQLQDYLLGSLRKIQKRLGSARYNVFHQQIRDALAHYKTTADSGKFSTVFYALLTDYYDPMYDYQLNKKQSRIIHKGSSKKVLDYLQNLKRT
ncbi:MAG: tRNA 2-selenouridine(34) synthase MnmH [Cocleimonas sp.]|nr:tRNA 2-selenouridine(34) synthase MnmH [Cocleimonas sp.]